MMTGRSRRMSELWRYVTVSLARNPFFLSATEALVVFVISNAALGFLVFATLVSTPNSEFSLSLARRVIGGAFSPTETLVYILAILAPAIWIMVYQWRARRHPVFYWTLFLLQVAIIVGSAYIYGKGKLGTIENVQFASDWGEACYLIGLVIWYTTLVYDKKLRSVEIPTPPVSGARILQELGGK